MEIKYYKEIDCQDYDAINSSILSWIERKDLFQSSDSFWNPVDTLDFMKSNPAFREWCVQKNLKIQNVVVTLLRSKEHLLRPHTDTPPARFKLSWPVLNASTTWNRWFKIRGDSANRVINNLGGTAFPDITQLEEIDRRRLVGPALIDAGTIHDVEIAPDQKYPRVGLQCQIFNEPESL